MAKKGLTYIDAKKFEDILLKHGAIMTAQRGYVRVDGPTGRRLYVARTKNVGRVDLSGFEVDPETFGVRSLGGESFGAVKQQLNFEGLTEEQILGNFEKVLTHMATLPAVEKAAKAKPDGTPRVKATGWTAAKPIEEMSDEEKNKRAALIRKVAKEKGAKVSKKAGVEEPSAQ